MSLSGISHPLAGTTTGLAGLNLGDTFVDNRGREFRIYAVSNSLTGTTFNANDVGYIAATSVTYPTGQTGSFTVTNTRANAQGGANNYATVAGIAMGTVAQAASAAAADNIFALFCSRGRVNVAMINNNAVAGDYIIHSGNGTADRVLQNDTTAQTTDLVAQKFGRCVVAAASNVADCVIHDRVGGL